MGRYYEFCDICGSCGHLDMKEYRGRTYYCNEKNDYIDPLNLKCPDYKAASEMNDNRDYWDIKKITEPDCYLTTIICDILGMSDNCEILTIMRSFRNNVLQKDLRYLGILMEYDTIGPKISECLKNDEDALWIAKELLENFIKPIIVNISSKNYEDAINMYINMTSWLKENYCIDNKVVVVSDYDQSKGGHGRVYKKVNC